MNQTAQAKPQDYLFKGKLNQLGVYSVILTELGISVFNGDKPEKSFPFHDMVKEYVAIKKKQARLDELVNYLAPIQRGIKTSDESLLALLRKESIDAELMDESEMEEIQTSKPQIIVDSGFAENIQEVLEKLRDFSLGLSSAKVSEVSASPDMHIVQAITMLDEIDKTANILSSGLREWYGLHFPELENIVDGINGYAQTVLGGRRDTFTKDTLTDAGFPESKVEMILLAASNSNGGDITDSNLSLVKTIAEQLIKMDKLRREIVKHVESQMHETAPNMTAVLGATVGARILRKAGSLKRVAGMPSSTIQVLGAEKALFRSLKTGSQPPKHGLLFQHALVHTAPKWQRGKIARAIAAKTVIAARVDVYGQGINEMLLEKLNLRVDDIGKRYEKPPERDTHPRHDKRDGGNFRKKRHDFAGKKFKHKSGSKSKKRKRFGKR